MRPIKLYFVTHDPVRDDQMRFTEGPFELLRDAVAAIGDGPNWAKYRIERHVWLTDWGPQGVSQYSQNQVEKMRQFRSDR